MVKHPDFALSGKKALLKSDIEYELVLIDATESSNRTTKKSRNTTTFRKKDTL